MRLHRSVEYVVSPQYTHSYHIQERATNTEIHTDTHLANAPAQQTSAYTALGPPLLGVPVLPFASSLTGASSPFSLRGMRVHPVLKRLRDASKRGNA